MSCDVWQHRQCQVKRQTDTHTHLYTHTQGRPLHAEICTHVHTHIHTHTHTYTHTIFRSISMRLIYRAKYSIIDRNISNSQVVGRKGKSVRNHVWISNGIIIDVWRTKKKTPIDVQIFYYKQCFHSLWLQECLNDLYDSGVRNNNLALLYTVNKHVKVVVKTPVGKTNRESIFNCITQGELFRPILCSN